MTILLVNLLEKRTLLVRLGVNSVFFLTIIDKKMPHSVYIVTSHSMLCMYH
jgi:hypothetical protein